jgi:hypothetical protein
VRPVAASGLTPLPRVSLTSGAPSRVVAHASTVAAVVAVAAVGTVN